MSWTEPTEPTEPIEEEGIGGPFEDVATVAFIIHCLRGFPRDADAWQPRDYLRFFATGVGFLAMNPDDPDVRGEVRCIAERFAESVGVTPSVAVEMLASDVYRSLGHAVAKLPESPAERAGMLRRIDEVLGTVTADIDAPIRVVLG